MPRYTLKTSFVVEPKYLNEDLQSTIMTKLKEAVIGVCDRSRGYVEEVVEILEYDNYISNATSQVIFVVIYVAECVKPNIGDRVLAKVLNVSSDGIFCLIFDKCRTLIPMTKLHPRYNQTMTKEGCIENKDKNNKEDVIKVGKEILVEIINIRFENKQYSCIAVVV